MAVGGGAAVEGVEGVVQSGFPTTGACVAPQLQSLESVLGTANVTITPTIAAVAMARNVRINPVLADT